MLRLAMLFMIRWHSASRSASWAESRQSSFPMKPAQSGLHCEVARPSWTSAFSSSYDVDLLEVFSHEQHLEMMLHVVFEQEVLQMMVVVRVRHVEKHYETDDDEKKNQVSVHGHVE